MSVLASLIAALERANGDRLVLCSGETPHVIAGGTRHDLGTTKASVKALEALTHQILSPEARQEFAATNAALEPLSDGISPIPLVVDTHRSGDTIRIELRRLSSAAAEPSSPPATVAQPEKPAADAEWQPIEVQAAERVGLETRVAELAHAADEHATERTQLQTRVAELETAAANQASERERAEARVAELEAAASAQAIERERLEQHVAHLDRVANDQTAEQAPLQTRIAELARAADDHACERTQLEGRIAELEGAARIQTSERERAEARVAELEAAASVYLIERGRLELRIVELEALTIAATPVTSESVEADPVASESVDDDWLQPASGLGEAGFDEDAFGQSTALAADAEPDADEASFGVHQMKVVPIAAAIRTGVATSATDSKARSDAEALEYWIRQAALRDATALYLRAGYAPLLRVRQKLQSLDDQPLDRSMIDTVAAALASAENDWAPVSDTAWTRELDGIGRVTCQTFLDESGAGLVAHLSPRGAASALCKDIPRHVRRICEDDNGLVIVSAPALPDVMRMVAALGEWTAQRRAGYLVSIEPPNGLGHDISGMLVSARRIAGTERDVADAIRRAMHEGPDILVIALASGLIAEEAIRAAQSGCLVIVGVMAPTAPRAIDTLLSGVDSAHAQPLRQSLAASYRCGFSYRALPGRDGTRAVVQDLLLGTSDTRARLERADLSGLESLQRSGIGGMRSLDAALAAAVHRREATLRRAAGMASDRRELVRLVRRAAQERNRAARGQSTDPSSDSAPAIAGLRA